MKVQKNALRSGAAAGFLAALLGFTQGAAACDLCAIFNEVSTQKPIAGAVRFSAAEQFSYFGKVQEDGRVAAEPMNQHMASSITQLVGAYDFSPEFSLQVNVPYINRRFKRVEDGEVDTGTEAGIGDANLIGSFMALDSRGSAWTVIGEVFGGVKLPTGDSDRLGEEAEETLVSDELRHGGEPHDDEAAAPSAIHGHDLALGSGSVDFPFGAALLAHYEKLFVHADIQYILRTEGDFDYEYADDLTWSVSTGGYIVSTDAATVSLGIDLSGEYKREDSMNGEELDDTALRSVFIGPEIRFAHGAWRGGLAWDKPIDINNSGVQTVVTDRIRAHLSYWF